MNLTVTMFFSPSVFLCVRSIYLKRLESYQRNVQSSHFSDWLVILVFTALLVSITVYIEPHPRGKDRWNQGNHKQEKKTPNNPQLKVKIKVSHSLIAVGSVGLESYCTMGTIIERRSPSRSFRCLIFP